jgi:NAD(P)-dependent dehydrogenase (short-subunit alcohol dehydrogenase family)
MQVARTASAKRGLLHDKVTLITGASRGLGRALAIAYAREGAKIAICAREPAALTATNTEIEELGAEVLSIVADVSQRPDVERLVAKTLLRYDRIDVLVNNASFLGPSPMPLLIDMPTDEYELVLRTNVLGPFMLAKAVLPSMIEHRQGSIINVISDAGIEGYENWGAYGTSKAALLQMTRIWAAELKGTGVRVNAVDPGEMNTRMHALALPEEDPSEYPKPEEVVEVFLYLASNKSRRVSGKKLSAQGFEVTGN